MSLSNLLCISLQLSSYMQAKTLSCISESCWQTPSRVSRLFSGKYEGWDLKYENHGIQDKWMLESLGPTTLTCTESLKWQRYRAFKYPSFLVKSALETKATSLSILQQWIYCICYKTFWCDSKYVIHIIIRSRYADSYFPLTNPNDIELHTNLNDRHPPSITLSA